ncbi:MAG: AAA family ATPase [Ardenticatenaceae bacterium]
MMEAITTATSAVMKFAIPAIASGILGNRSNDALGHVLQHLREQEGRPGNHELPRAVRKAYLQATLYVCERCRAKVAGLSDVVAPSREVQSLDALRDALEGEVRKLQEEDYVAPANPADEQVHLLLNPEGQTAVAQIEGLRPKLIAALEAELGSLVSTPLPDRFTQMVREGWREYNRDPHACVRHHQPIELDWFALLCAFFAHELKQNPKVSAILTSQALAQLLVDSRPLTLDEIEENLSRFGGEISQRLAAFDRQLSELTTYQREQSKEVLRVLDFWLPKIAAQVLEVEKTQQIAQAILRQINRQPLYQRYAGRDIAARVDDLIAEYTALFVGREHSFRQLDEFIAHQSSGFMLITAPAGFGKSALLANWVTRQPQALNWSFVVAHFFKQSHGTNRLTDGLRNVIRQLYIYHQLEDEPLPSNIDSLRDILRTLLSDYASRADEPLVIVLDGLDEMERAHQPFLSPRLFRRLPDNLFVIASARAAADESPLYLDHWQENIIPLHLERLPNVAIQTWLRQAGKGELAAFAEEERFVAQVEQITDGLPLYLRHLTEELIEGVKQNQDIRPILARTPPGFKQYVGQQLGQLDELELPDQRWQFFALLTVTKGALEYDEIKALTNMRDRDLRQMRQTWQVTRWLRVTGETKTALYTFAHPLLATAFAQAVGDDAEDALQKLMDWCAQWQQHKSPYALRHYAEHLANAPSEAFYALVCEERMRAWEALEGTYAGFLNDVEYAWQRAEDERDMAIQIKCALCRASVATLSANIPPELLAQAMKHGVLTPAQGLVIVQQAAKERQRATALFKLASLLPTHLLPQALSIAQAIQNPWDRARALLGLAPHLPLKLLPRALHVAEAIPDEWYRAQVLARLAPRLPQELLPRAIEMAQAIGSEQPPADALAGLAPHLPSKLLPSALEIAQVIESERYRADALARLAPHLPSKLLPSALEVAQAIESERYRADALAGLAPHLPSELLPSALQMAQAIQDEGYRADALARLAPHLSPELLPSALEMAQAIQDEGYRAYALAGLAPYLSRELLPSAIQLVQAIQDEGCRAYTLAGLAPYLPSKLPSALQSTRAIPHEPSRAKALTGLAPHLPSKLLPSTLQIAQAIESEWSRAEALAGLVPHLPSKLLPRVLQIAQAIGSEGSRAKALAGLGPHLPQELLPSAIQLAQAIESQGLRAQALAKLAPHLPSELLQSALQMAQTIQDEQSRAKALAGLAPHLPLDLLPSALQMARTIGSEQFRAQALAGLAPHLPSKLLPSALEMAQAIQSERYRADALAGLAPHLPQELLQSALQSTHAIPDERFRAKVLAGLAPHFSLKLLQSAIQMAQAIPNEESRAQALAELAPHLPQELLQRAIQIAQAIESKGSRAYALAELAPHLPQELLQSAIQMVPAIESQASRAKALAGLVPHLPQKLRQRALQMAQAIESEQYRARALAGLAPHLPSKLLPSALQMAQAIESEQYCARALAGLAPHLPLDLLPSAIEMAQAIESQGYRAYALAGLAPHLPSKLLASALEMAEAIQDEQYRAQALARLAPHLPSKLLPSALEMAQAIQDRLRRAQALTGLASHLPQELLPSAIKMAQTIQHETFRAKALAGLAPHLPLDLLSSALQRARAIQDEESRVKALAGLAPHLPAWAQTELGAARIALQDTLRDCSAYPRPEFLNDLHVLMPFTLAVAGEEVEAVAEGIFRAIQEVCAWWA